MNIAALEEKIQQIKSSNPEPTCHYAAKEKTTQDIINAVNGAIDNRYSVCDSPGDCSTLRNQGMLNLGPLLTQEQLDDIDEFLFDKRVYNSHVPYGDGTPRILKESTDHFPFSCYSPADVIACPHLLEVALDSRILGLVSDYLKCLPTLYSMNMWWSVPHPKTGGIKQWHRDYDDFKFLALFIYLRDVDEETGPHVFVRFTHDQQVFADRKNLALDDPAVRSIFPPSPDTTLLASENLFADDINILTGSAGDAYLLDTYGVHKGSERLNKFRLVLWLRYGLHRNGPSMAQIPKPFSLDLVKGKDIDFDPTMQYVTRILLDHNA